MSWQEEDEVTDGALPGKRNTRSPRGIAAAELKASVTTKIVFAEQLHKLSTNLV